MQAAQQAVTAPPQPVDVAPPGHPIQITWAAVPGATGVEVTAASVLIGPNTIEEEPLGELQVSGEGDHHRVVTVPGGERIVELTLEGLEKNTGDVWAGVSSSDDLEADGHRLAVSIEDAQGEWIPLYTVPRVPARGILPPMFGGAGLQNGILTLPGEFPAAKLRLSVVQNASPEDFEPLPIRLERAFGKAALPSRNLELVGPDGGVIWTFPGEMPATMHTVEVDLRAACESTLKTALAAGASLEATFHLRGTAPGQADFARRSIDGAVMRAFPGVIRTELEGVSTYLALADRLAGIPLADEQPTSVTADLTVRYAGLRLLSSVMDAVPAGNGGFGGVVVGEQPVVRPLPEEALANFAVARAGLIGRAPEPCELAVQLVDMSTGIPGSPLGPPGVVELPPSAITDTIWIDLPETDTPGNMVGVSAHTNRGRFLWVADPEPRLRLAVHDPDPGGRSLRLSGHQILAVTEHETHLPAIALPPDAFQSGTPLLESDLFLTVDLSDLVLRYQR
jgi:hypothetical protein